ncbi:MAG: NAD(P)H-dependent glycerol-3-phosphate dehydrogenase [Enterobacteriaceae bacterium]|nr:NAD(P)H-dependent glycerol-3-phosphate dehydrogenase [Enterobacteriaceae bacterium]
MIGIIGAGIWGTSLAIVIAKNGNDVIVWGRNEKKIKKIQKTKQNKKYFPNITFPNNINFQSDINYLLTNCKTIIIAIPSNSFSEIIDIIKKNTKNHHNIAWVSKGLDKNTNFLSTTLQEKLGHSQIFGIIAGPSFAKEVVKETKTSIVIASNNMNFSKLLKKYISNNYMQVYISTDIIGIQLGGVIKNVISVAWGILTGLKSGENTKSAFVIKYLQEIKILWTKLNADFETFTGLACFGDILLGCTNTKSRNTKFGIKLAKNMPIKSKNTIESIENINTFYKLFKKHKIKAPLTKKIRNILFKIVPVTSILKI